MANENEHYNEDGEFILGGIKLYPNNVQDWADLLEDADLGRLVKVLFFQELRRTGAYDDTSESKLFRAALGSIRRNILTPARIAAERKYLGNVQGANTTNAQRRTNSQEAARDAENKPDKDVSNAFKPPSKTAFKKLAFEIVDDLIKQGRRKNKISESEAYEEFDYLKAAKWKISRDRPIQSEEELRSLLSCVYDFELLKLLEKTGAPKPVVLGTELLSIDKLQKRGVFCWGGVRAFAECYNTLSYKWIIDGEDYYEWRAAFNAFTKERLTALNRAL